MTDVRHPAHRIIVGGVGKRNLGDYSFGVAVSDRLIHRHWLIDVVVEDLSYDPMAVVRRLQDETAEQKFERVVLVAAVARGSKRWPGTVTPYRWDCELSPPHEVERAIREGETGVISLDNTLIVARHFGALPADVVIVEVEPISVEAGDTFSAPVAGVFHEACELVANLAVDARAIARLARAPLGGEMRIRRKAT